MKHAESSEPSEAPNTQLATTWTLSTIQKTAAAEFPTHFYALPPVQTLTFVSPSSNYASQGRSMRPDRATTIMLVVGYYDGWYEKPQVFASIYREKGRHQVEYIYQTLAHTGLVRVSYHRSLDINFEEPFSEVEDPNMSSREGKARLRAVILYYFLAAGHIQEISGYNNFWVEFQRACSSIARSNADSDLNSTLPTQDTRQTTPDSARRMNYTSSMPSLGKCATVDMLCTTKPDFVQAHFPAGENSTSQQCRGNESERIPIKKTLVRSMLSKVPDRSTDVG